MIFNNPPTSRKCVAFKTPFLLACFTVASMIYQVSSFVPTIHSDSRRLCTSLGAKKISMAQKRKNRAKRLQTTNTFAKVSWPTIASQEPKNTPTSSQDDTKIHAKTPAEAADKARQLLESQRESVNMLTFIRERVERLDETEVLASLEGKGYCCIDNFLDSEDVTAKLEQEFQMLFDNEQMQADVDLIGSGEYLCALKGGQEQYPLCPRSIEFVVSTTKYFPGDLDKTKTMANARMFSYKALQASLQLLTGEEGMDEPIVRDFRTIREDETDARQVSMVYYTVPKDWSYGGGMTFENGGKTLSTKRDRLVIWKSSSRYRPEPWKGSATMPFASCIELHLVASN